MARIIVCYRQDYDKQSRPMPSYAGSIARELSKKHELTFVGEGHKGCYSKMEEMPEKEIKKHDLFLDIDCGRSRDGKLHFQYHDKKCPIPNAIRLIDTHGYPSLHRRIAKNYSHVFFAVYRRRDLFSNLPSAHWCPNSSDDVWFDYLHWPKQWNNPENYFGFFGSKGGLERADDLVSLCTSREYPFDVREIGAHNRSRWPGTAKAMANCKILYNRGQKHDGPNQRVIESMLMRRPLISDRDKEDGMSLLFEEGTHFLSYDSKAELGLHLDWALEEYDLASNMAKRAYILVKEKHLVKHRVQQIEEICLQ